MKSCTLISVLHTAMDGELQLLSWWVPEFMDHDLAACLRHYVELMGEALPKGTFSHLTQVITLDIPNE